MAGNILIVPVALPGVSAATSLLIPAGPMLKPGSMAPNFTLASDGGGTVSLSQLKGRNRS